MDVDSRDRLNLVDVMAGLQFPCRRVRNHDRVLQEGQWTTRYLLKRATLTTLFPRFQAKEEAVK